MEKENKTKEQLIRELASLRESLCECAATLQARNQDLDDLAHYVVSEFRRPLGVIIGFAELLEEEYQTLLDEDLRHCMETIKQSGRKLNEMTNVLLLLANSRRLFDNVWYTAYLMAMGETSLSQWAQEKHVPEVYRFTCLPTTSGPLVIRVWATGEKTPCLQAIAKLGSGREGYEGETGLAPQEAQWTPEAEEWDGLLTAIEESKFWTVFSSLRELGWLRMVGTESEEWVFEGWRDNQYQARTVWSPDEKKAHAAYALGRSFVKTLPGWFALEVARSWAVDSWPEIHPRFRDKENLSSPL